MDDDAVDDQDDHHHRRQRIDEVHEGQTGRRPDDDVGRIADQGRGAADVAGEDLGEQERIGLHVQLAADHQRDRRDQQHRGHVVEQRRQHRRDDAEHDQDAGRAGARRLGGDDGDILEDAGAARDRHDQHHAGQQRQGVEVDALDRLLLVQDAERDHEAGAHQRHDGAVELLGHDGGVGDDQQRRGHPQRIEAEQDVSGRGFFH